MLLVIENMSNAVGYHVSHYSLIWSKRSVEQQGFSHLKLRGTNKVNRAQ